MLFDFDTFARLVQQCYEPGPYTLEDTLGVFRYYFCKYELEFSQPHPNIRMEQIRYIMRVMPYIVQEDRGAYHVDIDAEAYKDLIDQHFRTRYRCCDYNINHFFSGRIRELRFFETCF